MKKLFKPYAIVWAISLVIFNVVCFVTPNELAGYTKLDKTFWTAYIFITIAFIGQLVCAYIAFKAQSMQRLFYNIPLIRISYIGLVLSVICGSIVMAIPDLPSWIGAIVCVIVLGFTALAVVKANTAAEIVADMDEQIKAKTVFIKDLTAKAENLMAKAKISEVKTACKKVYEALRFSDPMSSPELNVIEAKIAVKMDDFSSAVDSESCKDAQGASEELLDLIKLRNQKCKMIKS